MLYNQLTRGRAYKITDEIIWFYIDFLRSFRLAVKSISFLNPKYSIHFCFVFFEKKWVMSGFLLFLTTTRV